MQPARVPILTYHSIDSSGSVLSIAPADFREHVRLLADHGYTGIRFDRLIDAFEGRGALPPNPVVITFDDAYANFREHALPALSAAGFSATVFTIAGLVGKAGDWPGMGPAIPRLPLLDWPALREVAGSGFEIGSHAYTHCHLDHAPATSRRAGQSSSGRRGMAGPMPGQSPAFPTSPAMVNTVAENPAAPSAGSACSRKFA